MTNSSEVAWYFVNSHCFLLKCVHSVSQMHAAPLPHFCYLFSCRLTSTFHLFRECHFKREVVSEANMEMDFWVWSWACEELGVCFRGLFSIWTMFSDSEGTGLRALVAYLLSCLFSISDFSHVHLEGSWNTDGSNAHAPPWIKVLNPCRHVTCCFTCITHWGMLHVQERLIRNLTDASFRFYFSSFAHWTQNKRLYWQ